MKQAFTHARVRRMPAAPATSIARRQRVRAIGIRSLLAGVAALALGSPAFSSTLANGGTQQVAPEMCNQWFTSDEAATGFEIDFAGDVTANLPAQVNESVTNPFYWFDPAATNPTTVVYDPVANVTRLIMSSSVPLPATPPNDYPWGYNAGWHTGAIEGPNSGNLHVVSEHWIYPAGTDELNILSPSWNGILKKGAKEAWLLTYMGAVDPKTGAETGGSWCVTPYNPNAPKTLTMTNFTDHPIKVDRIGFIPDLPVPTDRDCLKNAACPANQHVLDTLNWQAFPPPGDPGSQFKVVKTPKMLAPGQGFTFKIN